MLIKKREKLRERKRAPDKGVKNKFIRLVVVAKHSSIREGDGGCEIGAS